MSERPACTCQLSKPIRDVPSGQEVLAARQPDGGPRVAWWEGLHSPPLAPQ